ncbi:MAG: YchF/TatD family DNA exonuclease [Candidatus Dasytiphilus stammeri]
MFLVDSHCHIYDLNFDTLHKNVNDVLKKAAERQVKFILAVATTLSEYKKIIKIVSNNPQIAYSCGLHPLKIEEDNIKDLRTLVNENKKIVALGETGLDYHYPLITKQKQKQQMIFREHIRIGCDLDKPVIVHTRNAKQDTLNILQEEKAEKCSGVIHCYTEDITMAKKILNMGFYISFSGIITFKNASNLREVIRYIPLKNILIETDSPYLAPVPYRGQENQPAWLYEIAVYVAEVKKISLEKLAKTITNNFSRLFKISLLD